LTHIRERSVYYGKGDTFVYRTHATPLRGVRRIPESGFEGRDNTVFGANVEILVHGEALWPAYTHGDNASLVATDSMKNFVQRESLNFEGATLEAFVDFLALKFLTRYPHLEGARVSASERPFHAAAVPGPDGPAPSALVFSEGRAEHARAFVQYERRLDALERADHGSGVSGLRLLKVTGSAFHGFIRDEYTTLPDLHDRALFTHLEVSWRYADPRDGLAAAPERYVPAEQVRDVAAAVFDAEGNESIQQLMHRIGTRLLERYPELEEVSFEGQNRTWEQVGELGRSRAFTEPRPPYGVLGLRLRRGA
jgi:urate oxidase